MTKKRPGEGKPATVVEPELMERKLRAALSARQDREVIILARTDAYRPEGLDAALRRAERYLAAGADGIFVAGLNRPEELERVGRALHGAIQIAVVTERLLPLWPGPADLYAMGFGQVVYPQFLVSRMAAALADALAQLKAVEQGVTAHAAVESFAVAGERLQEAVGLSKWIKVDERFG